MLDVNKDNLSLSIEKEFGKVYISFTSHKNHICGRIAVGNEYSIPRDLYSPEQLLEYFFKNGYKY